MSHARQAKPRWRSLFGFGLELYPPDRALSDELLAASHEHLGAESFDSLIATSSTLSLTDATAQARQVLTTVADDEPLVAG